MNSHTLKLFLLLTLFATLTACDTQPVKPEQEITEPALTVTEKQATLTEEAEKLLELAEDSDTEEEQFDYRAQAARLYLEAGDVGHAQQQLAFFKRQTAKSPGYR